jgi:hypothetical protein
MELCMKCRWSVPVKVTKEYVLWSCLKSEKLTDKENNEFMTEKMEECKQYRKIQKG